MSNIKKIKFLIYSFVFFSFISCDAFNKHETIPTYIHIDNFSLSTEISTQGSNFTNISDAWVSVDADAEEVYELPSTFPELKIGKHKITVFPGIKINGIAANRCKYPFYTYYSIDTVLVSQAIIQINPKINYKPGTQFSFIENFESNASYFKTGGNSDTSIIRINDPDTSILNNKIGAIYLDDNHGFFECYTDSFNLPKNGTPVYLEMTYRNNTEFNVGIYAYSFNNLVEIPIYTVNPHFQNKNKVYIDLTFYINSSSGNATFFKIYIKATNPGNIINPLFYIDDIKLLHF
jgi:hypothetical protein